MRKSTKNAIVAFVAILLALAIVIACGVGSSWFTNGDIATWFNSWGKGEQTEQPDEETPEEGGENGAVLEESESNGVALMSAKIATADYEAYGVSPLADTAYTLTATITPSDATNKAVTYSVAWKNASSSWASGKTVTDYVTVSQATTGSLTATVTCLQAFGEQIIVTCAVTDNVDLKATCTVDYLRKPLGSNITIEYSPSTAAGKSLADPITWSFNYSDTNPVVDFPYAKNVGGFSEGWSFAMCNAGTGGGDNSNGSYTASSVFSDVYTIDNSKSSLYQYSIAITQTYYDILDDLGFTMTCTAEKYISLPSNGHLSIGNLISGAWMSDIITYSEYVSIRTALKSHAGEAMFRIKYDFVATEAESDSDLTSTVYNVSFSAASFNNILAEGVSLDDTSIVF